MTNTICIFCQSDWINELFNSGSLYSKQLNQNLFPYEKKVIGLKYSISYSYKNIERTRFWELNCPKTVKSFPHVIIVLPNYQVRPLLLRLFSSNQCTCSQTNVYSNCNFVVELCETSKSIFWKNAVEDSRKQVALPIEYRVSGDEPLHYSVNTVCNNF